MINYEGEIFTKPSGKNSRGVAENADFILLLT